MPHRIALAWIAACGIWQLFVPPVSGIANNGDYSKVTGYYKLAPTVGWGPGEYTYFLTGYRFDPANEWRSGISTSAHLFVWPAVKLSRLLYSKRFFHIHALTLLHFSVYLVLCWAMLRRLPIAAMFLAAFVLSDSAYLSYLPSFYMDTTALLALLGAAAALLLSPDRLAAPLAFTAAALILIASKAQHAPLGLALAGIAAAAAFRFERRWLWAASAALVALASIAMLNATTPSYRAAPLFSVIFWKLQPDATDLQELGLSAEDLKYRGMHCYSPGSPTEDANWRDAFLARTGFAKLAGFYLRHPVRTLGCVWRDLVDSAWRHPDPVLGTRRQEDGFAPGTRSGGLAIWSGFRSTVLHAFPALLVFVLIASLMVGEIRPAAAIACVALGVATLLDTLETARHLFLFHVACDALFVYWLSRLAVTLSHAAGSRSLSRYTPA